MQFETIVHRAPKEITKHFNHLFFKKGDTILYPDETNDNLYIVTMGTINIFKQAYNGNVIAIRSYEAYTCFGEMELFNKDYRTVNVMAHTDCQIISLHESMVYKWIHLDPDLAIYFIEELTKRLANTSELRFKLSLLTIKERILYSLFTHYEIGDLHTFSKKDLCDEVSAPLRSINRSIADCVKDGFIEYHNKTFYIKNYEGIKQVVKEAL